MAWNCSLPPIFLFDVFNSESFINPHVHRRRGAYVKQREPELMAPLSCLPSALRRVRKVKSESLWTKEKDPVALVLNTLTTHSPALPLASSSILCSRKDSAYEQAPEKTGRLSSYLWYSWHFLRSPPEIDVDIVLHAFSWSAFSPPNNEALYLGLLGGFPWLW